MLELKFQWRSDRPSSHSSSSVHQSETRQTSRREPLAQDVGQLPDARQLEHRDQDRRGRKPQSQGCRKIEAVLGPRKFPIFLVESYLLKVNSRYSFHEFIPHAHVTNKIKFMML